MRTSLIVVDNFYKDPMLVRDYGLRQKYYYPYQADEEISSGRASVKWMASWFKEWSECPFKSSRKLIETFEVLTGDKIDMDHWKLSFPTDTEGKAVSYCQEVERTCLWNCCFHLKPKTYQPAGEGVHNHVTDIWNSVGINGWAGLIYLSLNAELNGGLKLWQNRDPARNYDWMTPRENWELVDELGHVFNRLILTRGNVPHSGAAGWGSNLENGRFYQTFFFKVLDSRMANFDPCLDES